MQQNGRGMWRRYLKIPLAFRRQPKTSFKKIKKTRGKSFTRVPYTFVGFRPLTNAGFVGAFRVYLRFPPSGSDGPWTRSARWVGVPSLTLCTREKWKKRKCATFFVCFKCRQRGLRNLSCCTLCTLGHLEMDFINCYYCCFGLCPIT